jgi:TonB family protein
MVRYLFFLAVILYGCEKLNVSDRIPYCGEPHRNSARYQFNSILLERRYEIHLNWENQNGKILTQVDQMPQFPGGEQAMYSFIKKIAPYPAKAMDEGIQGKVFIGFVVDKFGNILQPEVLRGIGGGCDEAALKAVEAMPQWVPGKQHDSLVNVRMRIPINFVLN